MSPSPSPPPSLPDENRELGLFDDPDAHDEDQLLVDQDNLVLQDNDGAVAIELPRTPSPQRAAHAPIGHASPGAVVGGANEAAANEAAAQSYDVAIPHVSHREVPVLAHAFYLPDLPAPSSPRTVYTAAHSLWFVRIVLLLVAYLNTHHHLTFRASNITLSTLRALFVALGLINVDDPMPLTLTTTLKHLDLTDKFHILIECPACRRLFKPDLTNHQVQCFACSIPLFTATSRPNLIRIFGASTPRPIPRAVAPLRLLSAAIAYLIGQPGIETYFDSWKTRPAMPPGEYRSIHDGNRWKTIQGAG